MSKKSKIKSGEIYYALEGPEKSLVEAERLLEGAQESYCSTGCIKTTDILNIVSADVCIQNAREAISNIRTECWKEEGWKL